MDHTTIEESLFSIVSKLFDERRSSEDLPIGVENVQRITSDSIRINFTDEVDSKLLARIAEEEGFIVKSEKIAPRVMDRGTIVARVGSRSDPGKQRDLFIYLIPPDERQMSMYRKVVATRENVLDPKTGRIDYEEFFEYNLRIVRLAEKYRREKYHSMKKRLKL